MTQSRNKRLRNRHLLSWNSMHPAQQGYRTQDSESRTGEFCRGFSRDAARSPSIIRMIRRLQLVVFAVLIASSSAPAFCAPVHGAAYGAFVSGVVRDTAGMPQ